MFGFSEEELGKIMDIIELNPNITKAVVFGSRAMGNYKPGSDVDIAVWGDNITQRDIIKLYGDLSEGTSLPYEFDLVNYAEIKNLPLKEHIDSRGKCLWCKTKDF